MISIRKRNNVYQYCFDVGKVNGKRRQITKSGFRTKNEAYIAGQKSYDEFINVNYKYSTAKRYKESFGNIKKELGNYKLSAITSFMLNQALLRLYQTSITKEALRNYQKVIKSSFRDVTNYFGFLKYNPAVELQIPKVILFEPKKKSKTYLFSRRN